ncbi:hypothetical protein LK455_01400 [Nocardia abscessus]|nr:hypothetical protein [Nocardia abscessus]
MPFPHATSGAVRPLQATIVEVAGELAQHDRGWPVQQPRRGQTDEQRIVVHVPADARGDGELPGVLGNRPAGALGSPPEQFEGVHAGQRRHGHQMLIDPADRLPAGRDDGQPGDRLEQADDERAHAAQHVFAVVQHQDGPVGLVVGGALGEGRHQAVPGGAARDAVLRDGQQDLLGHRPGLHAGREPGQAGPVDRVPCRAAIPPHGFDRQRRLADAAGPDQGDQPGARRIQ